MALWIPPILIMYVVCVALFMISSRLLVLGFSVSLLIFFNWGSLPLSLIFHSTSTFMVPFVFIC